MVQYLPLFIDFAGKRVVIFGGGPVGERKAAFFADAEVAVVSREFTPGLEAMPGVKRIQRHVAEADIQELINGAFLVIAATGNATLDQAIVRLAEGAGVLVNSVDGGAGVILPSKITRGDITIAIATGGKSPAMSRYIREKLEASLGSELPEMVRLQAELRESLKKRVPSQRERERLLWEVLEDPGIWGALRRSYDEALTMAMKKAVDDKRPNNE